jgi:hypothetical protein
MCHVWGRREKHKVEVGKPEREVRGCLEYLGANWRIILKCILQKQCGGCVGWINLAEDSDICEQGN